MDADFSGRRITSVSGERSKQLFLRAFDDGARLQQVPRVEHTLEDGREKNLGGQVQASSNQRGRIQGRIMPGKSARHGKKGGNTAILFHIFTISIKPCNLDTMPV